MAILWSIVYYIFLILYFYMVIVAISVVLLDNRNPIKQIAWIVCLILLPFAGLIFYVFFGRNYRKNKFFASKDFTNSPTKKPLDYDSVVSKLKASTLPYYLQQSVQLLIKSSNAAIYQDTGFDVFTSGEESFDKIFSDIENAKEHIHIEFFIIEDDNIGNQLRRLLIRKAQERVKVRVIYDYLGAFRLSESYKQSLKNEGVFIHSFLPFGPKIGFSKINYRNHRKIIVIDGKIGYTGGINIADRYIKGNRLGKWRDTIVRMEGEAVHGLQSLFLTDWYFVDNKLITEPKYYPAPQHFGKNYTQIVHSGPDTDWESILQGLLSVVGNAKKNIYIHTPYFLPPESLMIALQMAALSGVDVRVILPLKSDTLIASAASSSYFLRIMEAGVRIFHYTDDFLHSKAITIDDEVGIVGSANIDTRSFEHNYEVNAFIYDKPTAETLRRAFENDLLSCHEIDADTWSRRKIFTRLKESIARLFSPLL